MKWLYIASLQSEQLSGKSNSASNSLFIGSTAFKLALLRKSIWAGGNAQRYLEVVAYFHQQSYGVEITPSKPYDRPLQ